MDNFNYFFSNATFYLILSKAFKTVYYLCEPLNPLKNMSNLSSYSNRVAFNEALCTQVEEYLQVRDSTYLIYKNTDNVKLLLY
jgi:hypothetical protein